MFTRGFTKIADNAATGGTNNQGLEFKSSDSFNTTSNVGPGGMAPQGFDAYQPTSKPASKKKARGAKQMDEAETAQFLVAKYAKVMERINRGTSRAADGVTEGLKKDQETTNSTFEDVFAARNAEKDDYKKYVKAGLK